MEVVAELPPFLSKHGLSVKPVVGCVPSGFQPVPNEEEVWRRMRAMRPALRRQEDLETSGKLNLA